MTVFHELLISFLLVAGACFALVGSWGLIKLPDLMSRLHAPTKATTLGVGGALLASMIYFLVVEATLSIHELLISLFLFLTAPITAHFLAKAYLHQQLRDSARQLPPAAGGRGWATYDDLSEDAPGSTGSEHRPTNEAGEQREVKSDALV